MWLKRHPKKNGSNEQLDCSDDDPPSPLLRLPPIRSSGAPFLLFIPLACFALMLLSWKLSFHPGHAAFYRRSGDVRDDWAISEAVMEDWLPSWVRPEDFNFETLYEPPGGDCSILLLTAGDAKISIAEKLDLNRKAFAARHGYCFKHFECRPDYDKEPCKHPHFWRYVALWVLFGSRGPQHLRPSEGEGVEWVMYLDLDTMFTNFDKRVEDLTERYTTDRTGLIIAADLKCYQPLYPVNNGVMLFRNTAFARMLAYHVLVKQDYRGQLLLAENNIYQARGLKDQPILTHVLANDTHIRHIDPDAIRAVCNVTAERHQDLQGLLQQTPFVSVLANREMNSFRRSTIHFRKDRPEGHWRPGDMVAHLSGLTPMRPAMRDKFLKEVCDLSPPEVCPFVITLNETEVRLAEEDMWKERRRKEEKEAREAERARARAAMVEQQEQARA